MQQPKQIGIRQKWPITKAKWSPHSPDIVAIGLSENFGIVGKGMCQVKKIVSNGIQNVAMIGEQVIMGLCRMQFLVFPGLN